MDSEEHDDLDAQPEFSARSELQYIMYASLSSFIPVFLASVKNEHSHVRGLPQSADFGVLRYPGHSIY